MEMGISKKKGTRWIFTMEMESWLKYHYVRLVVVDADLL